MELVLNNKLSEVQRAADLFEEFGEENGIALKDIFQINLVLDELVSNVINYGYPKEEGREIFLKYEKNDEGTLIIEIRDFGVPFNILEMKEVDVSLGIEERAIGGLGIHLVKSIIDDIEYERKDGQNILILKKELAL
jgi:anti-sigma regulatory factor (Ser/Thr protein kinase)